MLNRRGIALRLAIAGTALVLVFAVRLARSRSIAAREREHETDTTERAAAPVHVAHARDAGMARTDAGVLAPPPPSAAEETPTDRLGALRDQIHLVDLQRLDAEQRGDAAALERLDRERARLTAEHDTLLGGPQGI